MDLVFIYLSITMFIFVLVLSSPLPPIGLTPALACAPPSLWALPLLQETVLVESQEGHAVGKAHLRTGSPVRL